MREQIEAIQSFEKYLEPLRVIYPQSAFVTILRNPKFYENDTDSVKSGSSSSTSSTNPNNPVGHNYKIGFTLHSFLVRQRIILHGYERKKLKHIPKIIYACGEQLKKLAKKWSSDGPDPYRLKQIDKITQELEKDFYELTHGEKYFLFQSIFNKFLKFYL
jgi:hypothetical protein